MDNFVFTEKGVVVKITNTSAEQVLTNNEGFISPTLKLSEESVHKDIIPAFKIRIPEYVSYGLINIAPGESIQFVVKKHNEAFYYIGLQDARMEGISISVTPVTDSVVLQDKVITPTTEEQIVTADEGYNGLGTVTVNAMNLGTKTITASDTYNAADDGFDGYSMVTVNVASNDNNAKFEAESTTFTFDSCLTSINIPHGVTEIAESAFHGFQQLSSVVFPSGLEQIRYTAFESCSRITSITLPNSVYYIESSAFRGCEALTSLTLPSNPNGVYIGEDAFMQCYALTHLVIPDNTNFTSESGTGEHFAECNHLASVDIGSGCQLYSDTFRDCDSLTSIVVHAAEGSIEGAPWGATNATVTWDG